MADLRLRYSWRLDVRSAAALAFIKIGMVWTRLKNAPMTNSSAVVTFVMGAPPKVAVNLGAIKTTEASKRYMYIWDETICLNVAA